MREAGSRMPSSLMEPQTPEAKSLVVKYFPIIWEVVSAGELSLVPALKVAAAFLLALVTARSPEVFLICWESLVPEEVAVF